MSCLICQFFYFLMNSQENPVYYDQSKQRPLQNNIVFLVKTFPIVVAH